MMLSTFTSSTPAAPAQAVQAAPGAQPAAGATAAADSAANPGAAASAGAGAAASPAPAAQPFAQWLGQQADAQALQASLAATAADADGTAGTAPAAADGQDAAGDGSDDAAAPAPDNALLAAMAMPLMPLPAAQVAQALQAAQGGQAGARDAGADAPAAVAVGQDGARAAQPQLAAAQAAVQAAAPATTPAPAQQATPQAAQQDGSAALRVAVHVDAGNAGGADAKDGGADHAGTQATTTPVAGAAVAGSAPAQAAADTVKLSGPPTAWRQSLQEALGERLNVQVGKNIEQAVIRLEPPQLGRIDIAIRHSAGTLEVNISASNGEVLRQLQTVSDNLRSDLSQRQYTDVAVTVTPAPKNGAAPFGDPQQQGRGRQQGRDQDDTAPGRALAEASTNASAFTLGGRDS